MNAARIGGTPKTANAGLIAPTGVLPSKDTSTPVDVDQTMKGPNAVRKKMISTHAEDGTRLSVRTWDPPQGRPVIAQVVLAHGYAEHSGRYDAFASTLAKAGIAVVAPDLRGHGRSEGRRGYVWDYTDYHQDLDAAFAKTDPKKPTFLMGHSNGGLLALHYVGSRHPNLAGVVVTSPYVALTKPLPPWKSFLVTVASKILPWLSLDSGLSTEGLSRDPQVVRDYENDPLVFSTANASWFAESAEAQDTVRGLSKDDFSSPLLYVYGDRDPIASSKVSTELSGRIADDTWVRKGALHEVLNEIDGPQLHQDIASWLTRHVQKSLAAKE